MEAVCSVGGRGLFYLRVPRLRGTREVKLFASLLGVRRESLGESSLMSVSRRFGKFPRRVFCAIRLVGGRNVRSVLAGLRLVVRCGARGISELVGQCRSGVLKVRLLGVLSRCRFVDLRVLGGVLKRSFRGTGRVVSRLSGRFVVRCLKDMGRGLELGSTVESCVRHSSCGVSRGCGGGLGIRMGRGVGGCTRSLSESVSSCMVSTGRTLGRNLSIPTRFLVPSRFMGTVERLCGCREQLSRIVLLTGEILGGSSCLSREMLERVQC